MISIHSFYSIRYMIWCDSGHLLMPLSGWGMGCSLLDVALIEEVDEQSGIGGIHSCSQIEEIVAEHAGSTRASDTPGHQVDEDTHEHLRELQHCDSLDDRQENKPNSTALIALTAGGSEEGNKRQHTLGQQCCQQTQQIQQHYSNINNNRSVCVSSSITHGGFVMATPHSHKLLL